MTPTTAAVAAVSVVVPVYNAETTLPGLLASLAAQDFRETYEVIVADDASTDASLAVARGFAGELPLVVCEATANRGPAAASNTAVARASAPVIAFCDADDLVHERWLGSLCASIADHRLVAGAVHDLDPRAKFPPASVSIEQRIDPDALLAYYRHLPWSMTANLAVRRDDFAAVGGLTEQLRTGYDADLCWQLAARGVRLAYEPDAIVFKRHRPGAIPTFRQYLRYGQDHPLLFRRHREVGMPRRTAGEVARRYMGTVAGLAGAIRHRGSPGAELLGARLGQDLGRLIGSVRWRSLYL